MNVRQRHTSFDATFVRYLKARRRTTTLRVGNEVHKEEVHKEETYNPIVFANIVQRGGLGFYPLPHTARASQTRADRGFHTPTAAFTPKTSRASSTSASVP
jgi:hypothetical protein